MWKFKKSFICPKDTKSIERYAEYQKYYQVKYDIAQELQPKKILEIGVRAGYSAKSLLDACPTAEYIGVDAENGQHGGQNGPWMWWAKKLLSSYNVKLIKLDSQTVTTIPGGPFDLIHIDGDHSFKGALHDMRICYPLLSKGGHLLIDDYDYIPTVKKAVLAFERESVPKEYRKSLRGEILFKKLD